MFLEVNLSIFKFGYFWIFLTESPVHLNFSGTVELAFLEADDSQNRKVDWKCSMEVADLH